MSDDGLSVLILAGGRSRRMGRDKVWLSMDGRPLVDRVARRVLPLASEVIFGTNTPDSFGGLQSSLGVPTRLVADEYPGMGPLAGMHAGLKAAGYELVLTVATDMPFVNLAVLRYMLTLAPEYDAIVPRVPKGPAGRLAWEPLHALYRRTCLPAIERHLQAGDRQAYGFLPDVRTRAVLASEITPYDPQMTTFFNVNTPEDWLLSKKLAGSDG